MKDCMEELFSHFCIGLLFDSSKKVVFLIISDKALPPGPNQPKPTILYNLKYHHFIGTHDKVVIFKIGGSRWWLGGFRRALYLQEPQIKLW